MDDPLIITKDVSKTYNAAMPDEVQAVKSVSIEIRKGNITILKGPSGSGKTTLLSLIGCMSRPTQGSITVKGKDTAKLPERFLTDIRRKTFGFIFQQFNLIRGITALENVMLPLYPLDIPIRKMRQRAVAILERLDMTDKRNTHVEKLSGGQQQRVAIGRALINEPEIILADEPTAHLDSKLSNDFIQIILKLNKEGKTIIISTHDPEVFDGGFVNTVIVMKDGMVKEVIER
ncbi:macrolide ABC transporter ATP-binding protein [Candidatus Magnetoovum chiemensis]|nr:macrolide ABC transporter ATP-binding protein [Candidatus Magnetoovum chiemensis]